jgi:phage shock protein E
MKHLFYLVVLLLQLSTIGACQSPGNYKTVEEKEFKELTKKENTVVLDVRTPEEYTQGHLENAQLMNYNSGNFQNEINQLDKSKTYLVYCKAGGRSAKASEELSAKGFKVYNLKDGISSWTGKVVK